MTLRTLIIRSLRFHWRSHLGVVLGAAVGSAALVGALVVGDSVRGTLEDGARHRLGWIDAAMNLGDRVVAGTFFNGTFSRTLTNKDSQPVTVQQSRAFSVLQSRGTISRQDGTARANRVNVLGISSTALLVTDDSQGYSAPSGTVILSEPLARQLNAKPGDEVILRVHKPAALSRETFISPKDDATASLRLKVYAFTNAHHLRDFSLRHDQVPPMNAFVDRDELNLALGLDNKVNLMLGGAFQYQSTPRIASWLSGLGGAGQATLRLLNSIGIGNTKHVALPLPETARLLNSYIPRDLAFEAAGLRLARPAGNVLELRTGRVFLDPPVVRAALGIDTSTLSSTNTVQILTYLVNALRAGTNLTPYSMVTAAGPPYTPADLRDDEIVINEWLAEDLGVRPGAEIEASYFLADYGAQLVERTNKFRVRAIVPLDEPHGDRTLMPDFPGIAKAESTHDWDAGFPLTHKIRPKDDAYWKEHRGTPKAFITFAAGQRLWANRFGELTSIRWFAASSADGGQRQSELRRRLQQALKPADLGLQFDPVREQAQKAASEAQDFGELFIGFSFFLIAAALILMALLFQFGLEQRTSEVGTLLALGFTTKQVRRLLLGEGAALAFLGGVLGTIGGVGYARGMLQGLTTVWREAVGSTPLGFHVTLTSLLTGLIASVLVSAITLAVVLRKQAKRPARELLAESGAGAQTLDFKSQKSRGLTSLAIAAALAAFALVGWAFTSAETANAAVFFGAGSLLLIAGLAGCAAWLAVLARRDAAHRLTLARLGLRGSTRRRTRSLATISLLAGGSFIVVAIAAFKLDANLDAWKRASGTGGFALIGQTALPVLQDLNTPAGREAFGLSDRDLEGVSFVPMRVREGDDASCLNLSRAQRPRLLGVHPELLARRGAFIFAKAAKGFETKQGWKLLGGKLDPRPSTLDPQEVPAIGDANSIQWALGRKLGDTLDYTDERGRAFKMRLVGAVANSILQGNLLIEEAEFVKRFPSESGYRMFLIDAPSNRVSQVSAVLSRALQDVGLEVTPAARRLAQFNAVQNTYLNTFQVLGGLGLLLGSAGLGVVVLRNVLERRGELGLLQAVGFRRRALHRLVLSEHAGLLGFGLVIGVIAAVVAILPALLSPGAELPLKSLTFILGGVLLSGLVWTWIAIAVALRGELLKALRNE